PIFLVLKNLKLVNTFAGLIAPTIFNAFAIFMLRQQMKTISDDFIAAAVIDGASYFRIFLSVVLPLSVPIIATLGVINFMNVWNDYYWPLIILYDKAKMTLTLALSQLNGQYESKYHILMAGSLLSMVPIIMIYIFAQKYFTTGLQLGGIKG
ncbi:MAG: carbohydrate ABC transporter permease, partial [Spirochaetota bacterium]